MRSKWLLAVVGAFCIFLMTGVVHAITYDFYNITNNNPINAAIGEAQFHVDVSQAVDGRILFTFRNSGPNPCSIDAIYFQDGPFLDLSEIVNSETVWFTQYAKPGNLAGGSSLDPQFIATEEFTADADSPSPTKGINPGESLGIYFTLRDEITFANVIDGLENFNPENPFRIGVHAQAFASGGSESFVNEPPAPVPEPATLLLIGSGLIGIAGFRRKKAGN